LLLATTITLSTVHLLVSTLVSTQRTAVVSTNLAQPILSEQLHAVAVPAVCYATPTTFYLEANAFPIKLILSTAVNNSKFALLQLVAQLLAVVVSVECLALQTAFYLAHLA